MIDELLQEMERNVVYLERLRTIPREEFVSRHEHYMLAERGFQVAIQCLLDVCWYVAAQRGWEKPADSGAAVQLMARQGMLTAEFATKIAGMANFRNILVHAYLKINRSLVYDLLDDLEDFREFARQTLRYLG